MSSTSHTSSSEHAFDPDALRAKYREERDRRIRPEGNDQYVEVTGEFAHILDDPYVEPGFTRAPLNDSVDVLVIGGGFGGLLMGAHLREIGVDSLRIIEVGGDFGGTWYWNRYPGAQCDVESYIYLPLLEEVGTVPSQKYANAPEILAHARAIGKKYELYHDVCFQTQVTGMQWDDEAAEWVVETNRDDRMRARFVCMASGPLNRPKLPGIPGVETFRGHTFHTSRWDYAYTGGDASGNLDRLHDKRVGIIGTGATAVQCVPHLGAAAQQLYVFQRTPSSIDVRGNRKTETEWTQSLEPGWHQRRMENFNNLVSGVPEPEDLVDDGWTDIIGKLIVMVQSGEHGDLSPEGLARTMELADFEKMEEIRARVDSIVEDPATAEALKPYYRQFCKRPCFHDDYLATFNRPNVTLVDTAGQGVDRITENAVVVGDRAYEIDCLIYATGFEVGTGLARRAGYEIVGRGGRTLSDKWAGGASTLHGISSRDFPNCFHLSPLQAGFTANFPHLLTEQGQHIAYIIQRAREQGARSVEPTGAAEAAWVQEVVDKAGLRDDFFENCTPGYYNNEGRPAERSSQDSFYGGGSPAYFALLRAWREAGDLAGLELR